MKTIPGQKRFKKYYKIWFRSCKNRKTFQNCFIYFFAKYDFKK